MACIETIGIRAHGVTLNVACDSRALLEAVGEFVPGMVGAACEAPDLSVRARWLAGPRERGRSWFPESRRLGAIGNRMHLAPDELVWFKTYRDPDLQLRFRREEGRPAFDVAYCYQPKQKKRVAYPDLERKKFFDLLRYLVHFPLAWHLERTRGWSMIHASAVARGGRAVLVAGPGGAGKTTTCLGLVARARMALLGENLLFCDGARVHPIEEPIRLTEESLAILGDDLTALGPTAIESGSRHKAMFQPRRAGTEPARAAALFLPQFAERGFVRRVQAELACERIAAANRLTLELSDYAWYASALDLLWPQAGRSRTEGEVLRRLTATTPCFELGIEREAGVGPVVDRILCCLDGETKEEAS
jgi:hypothetical protein